MKRRRSTFWPGRHPGTTGRHQGKAVGCGWKPQPKRWGRGEAWELQQAREQPGLGHCEPINHQTSFQSHGGALNIFYTGVTKCTKFSSHYLGGAGEGYGYVLGEKSVISWASQVALVVKNPLDNAGNIRDASLIPGSGRSPGGGHGNPLQYSCLKNPMDRGPGRLQSIVEHSQTQLSNRASHTLVS